MNSKRRMLLLISFLLSLLVVKQYFRNRRKNELRLSDWFHPKKRQDVVTSTSWLAPVLWEGTFSRQALKTYYRRRNLTVGLAVCAGGRSAHEFLGPFFKSASKYFMPGHRVAFYLISDSYVTPPGVLASPLHSFSLVLLGKERWRHSPELTCLHALGEHIEAHIQDEVDFLFCMQPNLVFQDDFGVETLDSRVALLHAWWYFQNTTHFPYERKPGSAAYIPFGHGDFYYASSILGGTPQQILDLVDVYLGGVLHDLKAGLNSTFEKHLNKYFFLNKPTKLLSPEYNWDSRYLVPPQVFYVKIVQSPRRR